MLAQRTDALHLLPFLHPSFRRPPGWHQCPMSDHTRPPRAARPTAAILAGFVCAFTAALRPLQPCDRIPQERNRPVPVPGLERDEAWIDASLFG